MKEAEGQQQPELPKTEASKSPQMTVQGGSSTSAPPSAHGPPAKNPLSTVSPRLNPAANPNHASAYRPPPPAQQCAAPVTSNMGVQPSARPSSSNLGGQPPGKQVTFAAGAHAPPQPATGYRPPPSTTGFQTGRPPAGVEQPISSHYRPPPPPTVNSNYRPPPPVHSAKVPAQGGFQRPPNAPGNQENRPPPHPQQQHDFKRVRTT